MALALNKELLDIQEDYRVQIHSKPNTWHDNNIQTEFYLRVCFTACMKILNIEEYSLLESVSEMVLMANF